MEIDLKNRRALVTGANSGIGRATALALAKAGARVTVNYVTHPETAESLCREIKRAGGEALAVEADVSDAEQVAAMFAKLDDAWGGIDILVNSAGIDGERAACWESHPDAWRKVLEVNLFGAFHCAREALKRMVPKKHGVIINITSVHEVIPWSGYSAYTASKAGLSMLSKTLAQEAAPHRVRVLGLAPGAIKSPINKAVWDNPTMLDDLLAKIPEGRLGRPEDIADAVVVLAADVSRYITGTSVFVDGGMTLFPSFTHGG
ncbi:MAG TPA: glucose 1-dehydrogenase [Gammaproteobacteria bacterium]|nr:glucose 1-dehydrogenase [Gammaproteobacteria bacterium]